MCVQREAGGGPAGRRARALGVALGVLALGAAPAAVPAAALSTAGIGAGATSAPATAAPAAPPRAVLLVVDGSDAMAAPQADGRPRWDAVREAVAATAAAVPDGAAVGLRLAAPDPLLAPPGCADTRPLVPVGPVDRTALGAALGPVAPAGGSSTAEALRASVDDLPANTEARVVLVAGRTGGCAPAETCGAARELVDRGVGLRVDAVAVGPDAATLDELRCVAEATGGSVRVADTAPLLADAVARTVLRALSPLAQTTLQPVRRDGDAPVPLPPGDHLDVLRPGESRRYDVGGVEGSEVLAAVSAVAPPELADRVVLRLTVGEGTRQDSTAVLLGLTRQSLRVRTATPAEATRGGADDTDGLRPVAGPRAEPSATVPVVVALEAFAAGGLPASEVPVQVGVDVVDTLLVVESPEPVVQQAPPPPPERVVVHVDRVPGWVWWLVGALGSAVVVLAVALGAASWPTGGRLDAGR